MKYLPLLLFLPITTFSQTTDFVDSLFNLYPKEAPYPEDVNFEVESDSVISVTTDNDQCIMQRWLHYPGATFLLSYQPADCAFFAPAFDYLSFNNQQIKLNPAFFQTDSEMALKMSWTPDESWHKFALGKAVYYYTNLSISNCNGTVCSFTLTVILREQNKQIKPFFFFNMGADLQVIDVDGDENPDVVEIFHTNETTGSFAAQNNHMEIRWLELDASGKFQQVKDPSGAPYEIIVRYPDWTIQNMKIVKRHWPGN